jgi:hypothetical protein
VRTPVPAEVIPVEPETAAIPAPAAEEAGTFPVRRRRRTTRPAAGEPVTPDEAPAGE